MPGNESSEPAITEASARDRILRAAEELFAERGFDRTPTSRIAEAANVPHGLIFYHFKTKMGLLLTLVRDYAAMFTVELDASRRSGPADADALIREIEDLWRDIQDRLGRYGRMRKIVFQELAAHPEIRQQAQELRELGTSSVARRLARATGHPEPQAAHVMAGRLIVSAAVMGAVIHGEPDPGVDAAGLARLLAHGLGSDG